MDLRELQKSYLDNLRKVTEDKLEIGSLVRTVISIEEGLVFKDGRKQKPKKLVIIGVDKVKKVCYGSVFFPIRVATSAERYCNEELFWWPQPSIFMCPNLQTVVRRRQHGG